MERFLEEEQLAVLAKLFRHAGNQLSEEERKAYDLLVNEMERRVSRLKSLGRAAGLSVTESIAETVTMQPTLSEPGLEEDFAMVEMSRRSPLSQVPLKVRPRHAAPGRGMRPEEVVRVFVECWDKQDFEAEYHCLSRSFRLARHHRSIDQYVNVRKSKYRDRQLTGMMGKKVGDIVTAEVKGTKATISCIESHIYAIEEITLHRQYELLLEDNTWKVCSYSTLSESARPRSGS